MTRSGRPHPLRPEPVRSPGCARRRNRPYGFARRRRTVNIAGRWATPRGGSAPTIGGACPLRKRRVRHNLRGYDCPEAAPSCQAVRRRSSTSDWVAAWRTADRTAAGRQRDPCRRGGEPRALLRRGPVLVRDLLTDSGIEPSSPLVQLWPSCDVAASWIPSNRSIEDLHKREEYTLCVRIKLFTTSWHGQVVRDVTQHPRVRKAARTRGEQEARCPLRTASTAAPELWHRRGRARGGHEAKKSRRCRRR